MERTKGSMAPSAERSEIILSRFGRVPQSQAHRVHGLQECGLRQMKLVCQELVWVLGFNSPARELIGRKVLEISLTVTMTSARPLIAAASTWRSSASGKSK